MKRYSIYSIGLMLLVLLNSSCKKFLDVSSENEILQKELFSDGEGIRIAVNGVYRAISSKELYGKNLSYGLVSAMGYNYEINSSLSMNLQQGANFQWEHATTVAIANEIWKKAYNTIANCNNIIQVVEGKDSTFFEQGNLEKQMILGEMIGVRAMLHFDLLRLYSPSFASGFTSSSIPYVEVYPTKQPQHLAINDVFGKIANDMEKARTILAPIDTIKFASLWASDQGRIKGIANPALEEGEFFHYRAQHMNYHAATILLARMHLYKGDKEKAFDYANRVYQYNRAKNYIRWTAAGNMQGSNVYIKRPIELVMSAYNSKNFENYEEDTDNYHGTNQAYRMKNMAHLFSADLDDYRYVGFYNRYGDMRYSTWRRPVGSDTYATITIPPQAPQIPLIRFSEVYHILIETLIDKGDMENAIALFTTVRTNRGAKRKFDSSISPEELKEELYRDIIKETLTEGQTFFFFKRLNRNLYNGSSARVMEDKEWFIPIPTSESSYQLN